MDYQHSLHLAMNSTCHQACLIANSAPKSQASSLGKSEVSSTMAVLLVVLL